MFLKNDKLLRIVNWKINFQNFMYFVLYDKNAIFVFLGYYDQQYRNNLFNYWCTHLQQAGILFRADLARTEVSNCLLKVS